MEAKGAALWLPAELGAEVRWWWQGELHPAPLCLAPCPDYPRAAPPVTSVLGLTWLELFVLGFISPFIAVYWTRVRVWMCVCPGASVWIPKVPNLPAWLDISAWEGGLGTVPSGSGLQLPDLKLLSSVPLPSACGQRAAQAVPGPDCSVPSHSS